MLAKLRKPGSRERLFHVSGGGMKIARRLGVALLVSLLGYLVTCLALVYWPIPGRKDVRNYDFSSVYDSAAEVGRGQEQRVTMRDGRQLFLRVYESDSPDTLLLLHGSGSESRYLSKLASWLSSRGIFRVVTPDLRGHGRNEGQRGDLAYLGQMDDDIEDVMRWLGKNRPGAHIVLGGHSSGGGLALRYAANHAVMQPDALLLLAPYLGHTSSTVKPSSGDWVTVAVKRWAGISMLNNLHIRAFNDLPVLFFNRPAEVEDALQVDAYSWRMAMNFAPRDCKEDIEALAIPTLVLVGEKDESFYPERFALAFEPAGDNASVQIVAGANHLNVVDTPASLEKIPTWKKAWLAAH